MRKEGNFVEYWDICDSEGNLTGHVVPKGTAFGEGEYHLAMEAWIVSSNRQILIQRRAESCEVLGGVWGLTTGRMVAGEDTSCLLYTSQPLFIIRRNHPAKDGKPHCLFLHLNQLLCRFIKLRDTPRLFLENKGSRFGDAVLLLPVDFPHRFDEALFFQFG